MTKKNRTLYFVTDKSTFENGLDTVYAGKYFMHKSSARRWFKRWVAEQGTAINYMLVASKSGVWVKEVAA